MSPLKISAHITALDAPGLIDGIVAADTAGLDTAWLTVGGPAPDPFAVFTAAAHHAERINFGTSIVPTFPRHPLAMAQGAMTVDQLAPNRLKLGVGPSHKPAIEGTWGIPFHKPLNHLREYVTVLNAVLHTGEVDFAGELIQAHARIAAPTQVQVMISALREKAFRLSGELTEGGISWMSPLPYIRDV
ncbi:MAG TPA: LLM class flavin-dependent oxidoreductase, partial [Dehalococcoidia bacterium]|nr:LLM class flavin-dependent oxidoreductase [Dehalococcoidia bacterium]